MQGEPYGYENRVDVFIYLYKGKRKAKVREDSSHIC